MYENDIDPFQYAFMFPVMTLVAIVCQCAGIGGAALLSPIFLLIFPWLGPSYPLSSAASSIACALLTECFGFASGLTGYWRRGLVDWKIAAGFLQWSVPAAIVGALIEPRLASQTTLLRGVYATLMLSLCVYLTLVKQQSPSSKLAVLSIVPTELRKIDEEENVLTDKDSDDGMELMTLDRDDCMPSDNDDADMIDPMMNHDHARYKIKQAADGTMYRYLKPSAALSTWKTTVATVSGAGLTGLLGVGIGEVVLPQLIRRMNMPLPVAAGTSVAIVVVTALTAASVQFFTLASDLSAMDETASLGQSLVRVVPWSLVQYTIPGAILGGQIAPWIAAKSILDDKVVEQAVAILFGVIGLAFAIKCVAG